MRTHRTVIAGCMTLLLAGSYYAEDLPMDETKLIGRAIECLGLNEIEPFEPGKKIIEFMI